MKFIVRFFFSLLFSVCWAGGCWRVRQIPQQSFTGRVEKSRFFLPFPPQFSLFLLSGCLLVEFWWCLKRRDPQMCTFGVLGLSCREERVKFPTEEGTKRAKFWPVLGRAGPGRAGPGEGLGCPAEVVRGGVVLRREGSPTRAQHVDKKKGNIKKSNTEHTAKHPTATHTQENLDHSHDEKIWITPTTIHENLDHTTHATHTTHTTQTHHTHNTDTQKPTTNTSAIIWPNSVWAKVGLGQSRFGPESVWPKSAMTVCTPSVQFPDELLQQSNDLVLNPRCR